MTFRTCHDSVVAWTNFLCDWKVRMQCMIDRISVKIQATMLLLLITHCRFLAWFQTVKWAALEFVIWIHNQTVKSSISVSAGVSCIWRDVSSWCHYGMGTLPYYWPFLGSNTELECLIWCEGEQTTQQIIEWSVIWGDMTFIWCP